jgi:hypothetical protein
MDTVPWVGNGWVQLTLRSCGSGMGTVVKPNAGLWYTPFWVLGPQKGPVFKPNGGQGKLPPLKLWQ